MKLAIAEEIEDGDVQRCEAGATCVAIFNVGGRFYATSDICTHAYAHLSDGYIDGETVECPLHQGLFHIPTGRAMSPPVTENLRTYATRVEGGAVYVEIDEEETDKPG
ncbi:non-heme iron oxygenase ferredoxin subunit [Paraburkholderia phymatum]|uniref:non-heme iron oxygenase ferredoxin subunit n=1 Tax=Paraburkholderia phymatum TaxID=148447 RepID=UPI0031755E45